MIICLIAVAIGVLAAIILKVIAKKDYEKTGAVHRGELKHATGLPIAEGVNVGIVIYADRVEFTHGANTQITLERSRITDVTINTETEVQTFVNSSIGGAVAGGVLFGPLGAIIGGRAKRKDITTKSHFLIFTYTKNDSFEIIAFEDDSKLALIPYTMQFAGTQEKKTINL